MTSIILKISKLFSSLGFLCKRLFWKIENDFIKELKYCFSENLDFHLWQSLDIYALKIHPFSISLIWDIFSLKVLWKYQFYFFFCFFIILTIKHFIMYFWYDFSNISKYPIFFKMFKNIPVSMGNYFMHSL